MKKILCFGDSNTLGFDPKSQTRFDETKRWPCLMAEILGDSFHIIEEGLGGRTTVFDDPAEPGRRGIDYLYPCIQSHQPLDIVIVMLGTNDMKLTYAPSAFAIGRGMEAIIKLLKNPFNWDNASPPQVLVVSPIFIGEDIENSWLFDLFGKESVGLSKQLAPVYEEISKKYNCGFLNAALVAEPSPLDLIHLDEDGSKYLAAAMADKVKSMLA